MPEEVKTTWNAVKLVAHQETEEDTFYREKGFWIFHRCAKMADLLNLTKGEIESFLDNVNAHRLVGYQLSQILNVSIFVDFSFFLDCQELIKHGCALLGTPYPFNEITSPEIYYMTYTFKRFDDMSKNTIIQPVVQKKGCIYCVKEKNTMNIKVGYSENLFKRINQIQTNNGNEIVVVGHFPGTLAEEKELHNKLRPFHTPHGGKEWYEITHPTIKRMLDYFSSTKNGCVKDLTQALKL